MKSKVIVLLIVGLSVLVSVAAYELSIDQGLRSNRSQDRLDVLNTVLHQPADSELTVPNTYFRGPLYDPDQRVRLTAINILVHRKITDFNDDLKVILVEGEKTARATAAKALGVLGTKENTTLELWRSLLDYDKEVRLEAIASIDKLHGTRLGFYYDQSPEKYRIKAQEALKEYLKLEKKDSDIESHAEKKYGHPQK